MRFVPTRIHGVLDYLTAGLLLAAPALFNFASAGPATFVPLILGFTALLYSFCTRYEFGAIKAIPMPLHLGIDFLNGFLLAFSPWLLGFADLVYLPHLVIGAFEMLFSLVTELHPRSREQEPTLTVHA